jgi:hypothetical protein
MINIGALFAHAALRCMTRLQDESAFSRIIPLFHQNRQSLAIPYWESPTSPPCHSLIHLLVFVFHHLLSVLLEFVNSESRAISLWQAYLCTQRLRSILTVRPR